MQFLKQIETLFRTGTAGGLTDGQLLERFLERRHEDAEAAFAALVDRHGAMVVRVCRQVLRDETDAEDAAQATFLVLARRARSISRRESLGCWLHGVALRVAANARTAAARRSAHELRGAEMRTAGHVVDANLAAIEDHDDWAKLHDELSILPKPFREPLVLCYLEGLTQEQAAAHLHCPLGTIQSRLARGRAKLKARPEKRGVTVASAFAADGHFALQSCPAPPAWAEATVKLAMQLIQGKGAAIAGASAATVALAEEVARAIIMSKLKITAAMIFFAAALLTGVAAWAMHDREAVATVVATNIALPALEPQPELAQEKAPALPERVTRTIRGIVRDEQGRPVAKAWVGRKVDTREGLWEIVKPFDRIRECKDPFRDEHGTIVPAGALGKYFELRDQDGKWQPIDPADIRRYKPANPFEFIPAATIAALERGAVFEVNAVKGRWEMSSLADRSTLADRTDAEGNFLFEFEVSTKNGEVVHFASPDFSRQAIHSVRFDDPDKPAEVTLRPVRQVLARLFATPWDVTEEELLSWDVYAVDPEHGKLHAIRSIGENGACWVSGPDFRSENDSRGMSRRIDVRLPAGHYKVDIESDIVHRIVEVVVPSGERPLDLPDIRLESMAWVKMLGKPAAEIEATDLDGKPFKLADYRGKVVVIAFWSGSDEAEYHQSIHALTAIQARFRGQALEIVALHDASLTSLASFRKALGPVRDQFSGEMPVRFLLDRAPIGKSTRGFAPRAGESGSGRTMDIYEVYGLFATFVIDKQGKLVFAACTPYANMMTYRLGNDGELLRDFEEDSGDGESNKRTFQVRSLGRVLEDLFGLPRSPAAKPRPALPPAEKTLRAEENSLPAALKGKVVDLDGKPIAGASVAEWYDLTSDKAVKTGPTGEFLYPAGKAARIHHVKIGAPGFASRLFSFGVRQNGETQASLPGHALIEQTGVIHRSADHDHWRRRYGAGPAEREAGRGSFDGSETDRP